MNELRIGIVGLGVISKFYLAAIEKSPSVRLAAVCDLREEALEPHRGGVPCFRSHQEMLERGELDAVIVNVPNDVHATVTGDALRAGVSVCVEKPLAIRASDGRALSEDARSRGLTLFTAFHRRYNDNALALLHRLPKDVPIASLRVRYLEKIEEHIGVDGWYLDAERCGGGCVADNGPNAFDTVRQFLGDLAVEDAEITRDEQGVDRQAVVTLRSTAGAGATVELDWSYPDGECKDISLTLADGTVDGADMLAGHSEFKSSLWHEYAGILEEFEEAVRAGADQGRDGVSALELVEAAYAMERQPEPGSDSDSGSGSGEDGAKRDVTGNVVKVLRHRRTDRGMALEPFASRCVRTGEVHELVTTDHQETGSGARIDRVGFLGFAEITAGGVIDRGDELWIGGSRVGTVLGFDGCHQPNHYNVLIATERPVTGPELGISPESTVLFRAVRR
ncbi:MAG: Gfo/Idh/MocA family oxidoreductase [Streptosporangiaceae bacterium]